MKVSRQSIRDGLFLWTMIIGLCVCVGTIAPAPADSQQPQIAKQPPPYANPIASEESAARRIALERYQFLKSLEPRFGFFPLERQVAFGEDYEAIYPVGSVSRVYLIVWSQPLIMCFVRKNGKDTLLYKADIAFIYRRAEKVRHVESLLDYVNSTGSESASGNVVMDQSSAITGAISTSAYSDLAADRQYVHYDYGVEMGQLYVSLLSDPTKVTTYDTGDPATAPFYKKHGLPVTKEELAFIAGGRNAIK